jgi:hypothetical protein
MIYDLVFEGGGAKGMVFVGAYAELVKRCHTASDSKGNGGRRV